MTTTDQVITYSDMFPIGPGATTTENSAVVVAKPFIGTLRVDGGSLLTTGALIIAEASPFANASVVLDGVGSSVDIICDPGGNNWLNRLEFGAAGRGTLLISPAGRCCRLFTTQRPTPTLRSRVWRQVAPIRLAARQAWRTPQLRGVASKWTVTGGSFDSSPATRRQGSAALAPPLVTRRYRGGRL